MVRGDGWKPVIEDLPNHINAAEVKELFQSPPTNLHPERTRAHCRNPDRDPELNKAYVLTIPEGR